MNSEFGARVSHIRCGGAPGRRRLSRGALGAEYGAGQNPYAFHAGIKDPGSRLIKFGQRWNNPNTGTWTQQDTLDHPLDPANTNRYGYGGDDPINGMDPSGQFRQTEECYVAAAGAIFSTVLAVIAIATAPVTLGGGFAIAAGFGSVAFSAYGVLSSCQ